MTATDTLACPPLRDQGRDPRRVCLAILALALGGFGIGCTEFVAMGLLPQIGQSLLPELWASDRDAAIARAGWLISSYALGVVIGAVVIAALLARYPRKWLVVGFTVAFTLGSVLSALAPSFGFALVARFLAALPHGAYFGVASLIAANLMGPAKRGRGIAAVMLGLSVANVIGVPLITALGQHTSWRIAYLAVAAVFALSCVAIAITVPPQPGDQDATLSTQLGAFRNPQLWFALGVGSIGLGGFFAVYSYISPLTTQVAGLGERWVPFILSAVGIGMIVGNVIGGRLADRGAMRAILLTLPVYAVVLAGLALTAHWPAFLVVFVVVMAAVGSILIPSVQTRLMDVAGNAQTLAAALNHAAFNIGNSLGAALGGAVIAAGLGFTAPAWCGVVLALVGAGLAWLGAHLDRAQHHSIPA